jgi:hypothetical protein
LSIDEGGADKDADWQKLAESMPDEAMAIPVKQHHRLHHHHGQQEPRSSGEVPGGIGGGKDNVSEDSTSEASSANDEGSVASSAVTGEAVEEVTTKWECPQESLTEHCTLILSMMYLHQVM